MSQNQSYFWQTTRHNVYLKRSAKYHLLMALMAVLTFSTICLAEMEPQINDQNGVVQTEEVTKFVDPAENVFNAKEPNVAESPNEEKSDGISTKGTTNSIGNLGFIHAFIASISVILVSELGDKTFFIAAIMAMRHSRLTVFTGAIGALGLMTVLSAVFGMAATIIPRVYTYYISTALFAIFGLKMLKEGYYMKDSEQKEFEEVESTLKKQDDKLRRKMNEDYDDTDAKGKRKNSNPDSTSDAIGTRLASNSEMQHRQRKQSAPFNNNNNNVDDDSDAEDENSSQRRAMLPMSATATMNDLNEKNVTTKLPSFQSSPSLSTTTAVTHVASNQNCDRKSSGDVNEICNDIQSNTQSVVDPGVHSSTSRYSLDLKATNSISNNSLNKTSAIGQSNGKLSNGDVNGNGMELKQLTSKKREREASAMVQDPETGIIRKNPKRSGAYMTSRIFMQAFTMTFLAEWGDRSQLTTIILSAREDVYGVIIGGVLGHSICTGLAVIGGRMIAKKISVRTVTIIGGIVFLLFAVTSLFMSPDEEA